MEHCAVMSNPDIHAHVIAACQQGDREAVRLLFETYKDRIYSIAFYFFHGDETSAKDIMQEVFLKLMTKLERFRRDAEFTTWLYRLVANACLDEQRRRRRFVFFGDEAPSGRAAERRTQEDRYLEHELADSVQAAIKTLKPKLRMAILLKYFEDLSYEEMAEVLGCSSGTVASRLHRGHEILARKLAHLRGAVVSGA